MTEQEETHMMQLVAISSISKCNTRKSLENCRLNKDDPYWTPAFEDVVEAIEREISLLESKSSESLSPKANDYVPSKLSVRSKFSVFLADFKARFNK